MVYDVKRLGEVDRSNNSALRGFRLFEAVGDLSDQREEGGRCGTAKPQAVSQIIQRKRFFEVASES